MKQIIIYVYTVLMALTIVGFAIFTSFKFYNLLFCEVSLLISLIFGLVIVQVKIDQAFKISFLMGNSIITGISYLLSFFIPEYTTNNIPMFVFISLIMIELVMLIGLKFVSKFT